MDLIVTDLLSSLTAYWTRRFLTGLHFFHLLLGVLLFCLLLWTCSLSSLFLAACPFPLIGLDLMVSAVKGILLM